MQTTPPYDARRKAEQDQPQTSAMQQLPHCERCVPARRRMPHTPKRGGGSFLPDANGHSASSGGGKHHDGDLLTTTDILYLKNVVLKFIQVQKGSDWSYSRNNLSCSVMMNGALRDDIAQSVCSLYFDKLIRPCRRDGHVFAAAVSSAS